MRPVSGSHISQDERYVAKIKPLDFFRKPLVD